MDVNKILYQSIEKSTAHRPSRDFHCEMIFDQPHLLDDLMLLALNTKDKNHHKACWILELVLERDILWLSPFLQQFCDTLPLFVHDGAVRSVSKICMFAAEKQTKTNDFLTSAQMAKITEACFDWLIGGAKVASKAYAMRALFQTGKSQQWVYPDLKTLLEIGYPDHSPAYQAAAKEILRKIGHIG